MNTNESQMGGLLIISEEWRLLRSDPPKWLCTWKNASGTVIRTWETESVQFCRVHTNSAFVMATRQLTRAVVSDAIPSDRGDAT